MFENELRPVAIVGMEQYGYGEAIPIILDRAQRLAGQYESGSRNYYEVLPLSRLRIVQGFGIFRRYRLLYTRATGEVVKLPLRGSRGEWNRYVQWSGERAAKARFNAIYGQTGTQKGRRTL